MRRNRPNNKQMQEDMERNMERKLQEAKNKERKEAENREAVKNLSRVPGNCPVGGCTEVIFPSNMMMHMLHKHMTILGTTCTEVFDHKPLVICFDPTGHDNGENHCLATILYGGVKGKPETRPADTYLCMPNTALIFNHHKYENHLPIMVMVCRSTWYAQLKDKKLERDLVSMNAKKSGLYVFWLVAPGTTRKLYYTLTVYDRYYLNSRSVIRVVRDYTNFQNPSEFLPYEDNFLLLRDSEVEEFLNVGKNSINNNHVRPGIPMELIVYEDPKSPPTRHSTQKELQEALQDMQVMYTKDTVPAIKDPAKRSAVRGKQYHDKKLVTSGNTSSSD